jgi:hypothetical protein
MSLRLKLFSLAKVGKREKSSRQISDKNKEKTDKSESLSSFCPFFL